jgi:hypothetical protein
MAIDSNASAPDGQPVMVGMSVSQFDAMRAGGPPTQRSYNLSITVEGEFLKAINRANDEGASDTRERFKTALRSARTV